MIEFIAVIFSLLCVWLSIKGNILTWSVGIVGIIAYFFVFKEVRDWSNMSLQIVFLIQSIYGWIMWHKKTDMKPSWLDNEHGIKYIIMFILLCIPLLSINYWFNGSTPVADAITTSLSIIGMILLAHKKLDAWIIWIMADIIYIYMFIQSQHYLSSGLYFIFLLLAIIGLKDWKKQIK